jgi:hypothetical protein
MGQMEPRRLYRIRCRNLLYGVWNGRDGFIGIREKFGHRYPFTEFHWDASESLGTVTAAYPIAAWLPEPIAMAEVIGTVCAECQQPVQWSGPPAPAPWVHLNGSAAHDAIPHALTNKALLDWLEAQEKLQSAEHSR